MKTKIPLLLWFSTKFDCSYWLCSLISVVNKGKKHNLCSERVHCAYIVCTKQTQFSLLGLDAVPKKLLMNSASLPLDAHHIFTEASAGSALNLKFITRLNDKRWSRDEKLRRRGPSDVFRRESRGRAQWKLIELGRHAMQSVQSIKAPDLKSDRRLLAYATFPSPFSI